MDERRHRLENGPDDSVRLRTDTAPLAVTVRRACAPGKLLLFGEHAAVYGYPALGLALKPSLTVEYEQVRQNRWSIAFGGADSGAAAPFFDEELFFRHLERTLGEFFESSRAPEEKALPPGLLRVETELPLSSGFGSSAALCTALARLILDQQSPTEPSDRHSVPGCSAGRTRPDPYRVWLLAHRLERFFHGTPSGIDTGISALGGAQAFFFDRDRELPRTGRPRSDSLQSSLPRARPYALPPLHLVVGSVPRETDTKALVAGVRRRHAEFPEETEHLLQSLGEIALSVIEGPAPTASDLGTAAGRAQEQLCRLGVSSPLLDRVLHTGIENGAIGGKLSGAGGGGAFFLVCDSADVSSTVEDAVRKLLPPEGTIFKLGP